ncbi:EamA family transporter [Aureimonas phyllosphaerae]|uniref:O-acetylserine/cysteine efflux transporter n=1 Tax=Aureimonas phyllosphaerae TaxID=1166078 RepID=A0A7W6FUJ0_9HYPH|nr:EamA family transporter [Aureimonas phyllosphaerae]MBB3936299.1 O-acetylserine/cysteine efflux transporter [Aureimonas phyllosphaerae]MBB3959976.1 O-acetylserine/cysteine efflux transporter [Aureimonas phyllosphaerae]SFF47854.1 O-acetylserine/cysteine efflux transporter [Aureimonas phyllosphaerae]
MDAPLLPFRHFLLGLAVVAVWGTNFVVIHEGLKHLPPLLFAALRFLFAALPGIFLFPRPRVPWSHLAAYGILIGTGQFGLLFIAMNGFISPGLASLVIQSQVFFTIALAMRLSGETIRPFQWVALGLGLAGLGVILTHTDGTTTPLGLALVLVAALSWAGGNIVARHSRVTNMLPYVIWGSVFSAPPLFALSFALEGWDAIRAGLVQADAVTWAAVLWQTVGNTMFGYAAWGWLLSRHPAALVTPMALLVPLFGMGASALLLGEPLPMWKIAAALLVMSGLVLGLLYPRWQRHRAA